MEALLLLVLIVPAVWILVAPAGMLRRVGENPFAKPLVVGLLLLAGWIAVSSLGGNGAQSNYSAGDVQLRALLD